MPVCPAPARRTALRRSSTGLLALGLVISMAACGDDDDETVTAPPSTAAGVPQVAGQPPRGAGIDPAACDGAIEVGSALAAAPQDPAEIPAFAQQMATNAEGLVAVLPTELQGAARDLAGTFSTIAETGDPSAIGSPEFAAASTALGEMVHSSCGLATVDVTAVDYAFQGVPRTLEAGRTSFRMVNEGSEEHEIVILRAAEGAPALEELLALPPDQLFGGGQVEFAGVTFGPPGSTNFVAVDLQPGTYHLVCNIPVGGAETGAPHHTHGMATTLTVA